MPLSYEDPEGDPAFNFNSAFRYSKVPDSDYQQSNDDHTNESKGEKIARLMLLAFVYASFAVTFPLTIWFCIKKVDSLQRCIIFRLGKRLPLKGPGFVVTFPCIDVVDTIDLTPQTYTVLSNEQLLTSDGSVIMVNDFEATISVTNAVQSYTKLKDSKTNVQQFIKLSFVNLVTSSHVEDLERKIDWILKDFVIKCNEYTCPWGWDVTCMKHPRFTVVNRAEPANALMDVIKGYFNTGDKSDEDPIAKLARSTQAANEMNNMAFDSNEPFLQALKSIAYKYSSLNMLGYDTVCALITVSDQFEYAYEFKTSSGDVRRIDANGTDDFKLKVSANTVQDALDFILKEDTSKVTVQNSLF